MKLGKGLGHRVSLGPRQNCSQRTGSGKATPRFLGGWEAGCRKGEVCQPTRRAPLYGMVLIFAYATGFPGRDA